MTGIIRFPRGRPGKVTKPGAIAQARRAGHGSISGPAGAAGVTSRQALAIEQALNEQQEQKETSQELQKQAQQSQQRLFEAGTDHEVMDSLPGDDDAIKDEYGSAEAGVVDSSMLDLEEDVERGNENGEAAEDGTDARTGGGGVVMVGMVDLEDDSMNLTVGDEARVPEGGGSSGDGGDLGQGDNKRHDETAAFTTDNSMHLDLSAATAATATIATVTDETNRSGATGEGDGEQGDGSKAIPVNEGIPRQDQEEEPQPQAQAQAQLRHQLQQQQQQQSLHAQEKSPTTAQVARDSGYYHLAVESALAKRLARERGLRPAQQRRPEQVLNLGRRSNVEALFAHIAGEEAAVPCKNCHKGHGPWTACVVVDGQMCGSCANCWFNASGARCSFHEAKTPIQAGHHLHTQRHHSSPLGPMVHHSVSAMSAAAAVAAPMVALDPHLVVPYGLVGGVGGGGSGGSGSSNAYGASISAIAHAAQIQAQAQAQQQQQQQHSQHAAHVHLGLPLSAAALPTPTSPPQPPSSVPTALSAMAAQAQAQPSPANLSVANELLRGSGGGGGGDSTSHSSSSTGDGSAAVAAAAAAVGSQPLLGGGGGGGLGFHLAAALMGGGAGIGTSTTGSGNGAGDDVPKDNTNLTTPLLSDASLVGLIIEQALAEVRQADARTRELMMVEIAAKQLAMAIVRYGDSGGSSGGGGKQQQQQQQQQQQSSSQLGETTEHGVVESHQSSNGPDM